MALGHDSGSGYNSHQFTNRAHSVFELQYLYLIANITRLSIFVFRTRCEPPGHVFIVVSRKAFGNLLEFVLMMPMYSNPSRLCFAWHAKSTLENYASPNTI
jgi:hypothetical protein